MKYDKKKALAIIVKAAKQYDIWMKSYNQQKYTECTYCSKGIELFDLMLPDKIEVNKCLTLQKYINDSFLNEE